MNALSLPPSYRQFNVSAGREYENIVGDTGKETRLLNLCVSQMFTRTWGCLDVEISSAIAFVWSITERLLLIDRIRRTIEFRCPPMPSDFGEFYGSRHEGVSHDHPMEVFEDLQWTLEYRLDLQPIHSV